MSTARQTTSMPLPALLSVADAPDVAVTGMALDSRRTRPGDAFFARRGFQSHGIRFARAAVDAGCAAVVYDPGEDVESPESLGVPAVAVPGLDEKLGDMADRFFGRPSAEIDVIGVTGTNGKTTVTWLIAQCLQRLGMPCAYGGTLGYGLAGLKTTDTMTTPDVIEGHRRLRELADAGASHAAIEVSSHALDQRRVDAMRFKAAVFSNLSRDHLDYHVDMAAYEQAKARLFLEHDPDIKVINVDTGAGRRLAARCRGSVVSVSRVPDGSASVVIRSAEPTADGFELAFDSAWGRNELSLPLFGVFNIENAGLVLAVMLALGVPVDDAALALSRIQAPPGRLQLIAGGPPTVLVDYAHTPDALESVLEAVRNNCQGVLWCIFGCGGDRDRGKRPLMARVAEQRADRVVVTNDNPRSEPAADIINDIVAGFREPHQVDIIEDRGSAIAWAIANAADADLVLIAGKGHETVQVTGDSRIDFSDAAVAAACLSQAAEASS